MDEEREVFSEEQADTPILPENWVEEDNDPGRESKSGDSGELEVEGRTPGDIPLAAEERGPTEAEGVQRDFHGEALELLQAYPHLRGTQLPGDVVAACARGARLLDAYRGYEARQSRSELARVRRENEILRHNAEAARRGPVWGVSGGGGTDTTPSDPFLDGFDGEE